MKRAAAAPRAATSAFAFAAAPFVAAASFLAPAPAAAVSDLVVVEEASTVIFESCDLSQPLARGQIAIKNIGDSRARLRLGVLTRYTRSLLAVYVPGHLDIMDRAKEFSALDAQDQESIPFSIGANRLKRGRLGGSLRPAETVAPAEAISRPSAGVNLAIEEALDAAPLDIDAMSREERVELQRALRKAGFYRGPLDGVIGRAGRASIRSFQADLGAAQTGELTLSQTEELARQTSVSLVLVTSATLPGGSSAFAASSVAEPVIEPVRAETRPLPGDPSRTEVTIYAVVDPYNLVQESNEANNLVKFTGVINCQ